MKKLPILTFAALMFMTCTYSQEKISVSTFQDIKLLALDDGDHGLTAPTLDAIVRVNLQGNYIHHINGYFVLSPEFEYANLHDGSYRRYSVNIEYVYSLPWRYWEASVSASWGFIDRWDRALFSRSVNGMIKKEIADGLKLNLMGQFTERKDLMYRYGGTKITPSIFIGLELNIFKK